MPLRALPCAVAALCAAAAGASPARCYDWILRQKVRGGYLAANTPLSGVAQMRAAGMNLVMPKFGGLQSPVTEANAAQLRAWGEAVAKAGLRLMPVFNVRGGETEKILSARREVAVTGQRMERTPCPLDESFWQRYLLGRTEIGRAHV